MTKNTAGRGLEAHTAILYALVSKGEEVLILWADHLRYDLAFVRYEGGLLSAKEPRLYRVQCKKARLTEDGSCIIFNAFNTIPGESGRRAGVKGYRGEIEYFGVFSPDTGKCYLVPVDAVPIAGARLRITKSRNNQEKGVRFMSILVRSISLKITGVATYRFLPLTIRHLSDILSDISSDILSATSALPPC